MSSIASEQHEDVWSGVPGACLLEVRAACAFRDVWQAVRVATELAHETFRPVRDLRLNVDDDPDTGDRRVVVDVTADADVADLHRRYDAYTRAWVDAVPADKREWVRLAFHAIRDE